jgi:hypothetical protein
MNSPYSYLVLQDQPSDYLLMLDMSQITACQVLRSLSGTRLNLLLHNGLTLEIPPDPAKQLVLKLKEAGILSADESSAFIKQLNTPPPDLN